MDFQAALNKNHGRLPFQRNRTAIFVCSGDLKLSCFYHRADALGAKRFLGLTAILINSYLLQIRKKLAVGCSQ